MNQDSEVPLNSVCMDGGMTENELMLQLQATDGSEKPIRYASCTLNSAKCNYSQLEKEGLSLVFGIKQFYSYLFGHSFILITDHKPLLGLLDSQKPTSPQASARVRCWSLYLSMFEYKLKFRNTSTHVNANVLSRLPLPVEPVVKQLPPEIVLLVDHLDNSPVTAHQIQECTCKDPQLAQIVQFVQQGWPTACPEPNTLACPVFREVNRTLNLRRLSTVGY